MNKGRVLWFRNTYGFIKADYSNEEIFFHWTDIKNPDNFKKMFPGDRVTFEVIEDKKFKKSERLRAVGVVSTERVSSFGKPLLRLSYIANNPNISMDLLNCYIVSKARMGLKFVNITHCVMATDIQLELSEVQALSEILRIQKVATSKVFYTGDSFKYDLMLV